MWWRATRTRRRQKVGVSPVHEAVLKFRGMASKSGRNLRSGIGVSGRAFSGSAVELVVGEGVRNPQYSCAGFNGSFQCAEIGSRFGGAWRQAPYLVCRTVVEQRATNPWPVRGLSGLSSSERSSGPRR